MTDEYNSHRQSVRLKGYDYSQSGAYFVTICTRNRECLFGEIADGEMYLNQCGSIVRDEWLRTAELRENVEVDTCVVMPNHIHGIIVINCRGTVLPYCGRMPLRANDLANLLPIPSRPSSAHLNLPLPNVSTKCAIPVAHRYGNATTTNTSSATIRTWTTSGNTSLTIRYAGPMMKTTRAR